MDKILAYILFHIFFCKTDLWGLTNVILLQVPKIHIDCSEDKGNE